MDWHDTSSTKAMSGATFTSMVLRREHMDWFKSQAQEQTGKSTRATSETARASGTKNARLTKDVSIHSLHVGSSIYTKQHQQPGWSRTRGCRRSRHNKGTAAKTQA